MRPGLIFFSFGKGVFFRGSGRRRKGAFQGVAERCHGTDIASSSSSGKSRKEGGGGEDQVIYGRLVFGKERESGL